MKKLFNFKIIGSILLLLALYITSCKRDVTVQPNTPSVEAVTNDKMVEEKSLLAQADQMGKTVYEHLKLNFLSQKAEDYVNPAIREKVMQEFKKSSEEMKNLTTEERIAKNLIDKKITEKQANYFRSLLQTTKELDGLTNFKDVENALNSFNRKLLDDKEMKGSEKQIILNASATIKSTIDYIMNVIYQPQKGQLQSRDFCVFGKKFSCIGSVLVGGIQIAAGLVGANNYYTIATGIVNSINAISNLFTNSSCDCSNTGATCYTLQGISVFREVNMNCSGNYIKFCTWGDGPSPTSFAWNISEINEYGEVIQNTSYQIPTATSCISLTPDANLNKMFRLSITTFGSPNCNNGQAVTQEFNFSWGEIVGNAGTVVIDGPSTGYVGSSSYYYANGTFLTNPKNSFLWVFNLSQGSYVFGNISSGGGNNTSIGIQWTGASCGPGAFGVTNSQYYPCYYLSIGGRSANSCSGSQSWGNTQVAVYNY